MKKRVRDERPACNECGSKATVKNGSSNGKQRFWCRDCGVTFHEGKPRYFDSSIKQRALAMALQGKAVRDIAAMLGASSTAVSNWVNDGSGQLSIRLRSLARRLEQEPGAPRVIALEQLPALLKKAKSKSPHALLMVGDDLMWLRA